MPQVNSYVTQNYRKTAETSNLGTRKLAFYTFTCDEEYGLVGPYSYGYAFRVNTTTGVVTVTTPGQYISELDDVDFDDDLIASFGDTDDDYADITVPFDYSFLSGSNLNHVYIDTNSIIYFADPGNRSRNGPNDPTFNGNNVAGVAIANNDGSVTSVFSLTTGSPGSRVFQLKFNGNTNFENDPDINLTWQVKFDEANPGFIDFLVTKQPTDWSAYNDGQGNVAWGVSDGTVWVDGRSDHAVSFADASKVGGDAWKEPNSLYYQIIQALQAANVELFWLGEPHNSGEQFSVDWLNEGLFNSGVDAFTFAIKDDAANPVTFGGWSSFETISVNDYDDNYIGLVGLPEWWIGQPIRFNTAIGGLTPNVWYYIADVQEDGGNTFVQVSAAFDRTPVDIELSDGVGGIPGAVVELTNDYSSTNVQLRGAYVNWEGTAGDSSCYCGPNGVQIPAIGPVNFWFAIYDNVPFFNNVSSYSFYRAQPSWGIFPAVWAA